MREGRFGKDGRYICVYISVFVCEGDGVLNNVAGIY